MSMKGVKGLKLVNWMQPVPRVRTFKSFGSDEKPYSLLPAVKVTESQIQLGEA